MLVGSFRAQSTAESLLLALSGGIVGIFLAFYAAKTIVALGAKVIPQLVVVSLDARVVAFTRDRWASSR